MTEVTIKAYTRKGKGGKVIKVNGYTRRVGRKGIISPKRVKSSQAPKPGEELQQKIVEANVRKPLSAEELNRRMEWEKEFQRVEKERKMLGLSREEYSRKKLRGEIRSPLAPGTPTNNNKKKRKPSIFDKIEDKLANFVGKYGGKYKR